MAQNIITLASEETCQDILARVRELETRVGEANGNIGEVMSKVSSAWVPRHKTATISRPGTIRLEIPYSESGYEIYYLSGRVNGNSGSRCSNKLTIDGKTIANISAYSSSSSNSGAIIEMRNLSYVPPQMNEYISTDSHIGDSTQTTNETKTFYLPFFGKFSFHSLVWEGENKANGCTFSIYYLEKAE